MVVRNSLGGTEARQAANGDGVAAEETAEGRVLAELGAVRTALANKTSIREIPPGERWGVRAQILSLDTELAKIEKTRATSLSEATRADLARHRAVLREAIEYAPTWVMVLIALSLGVGTMIGWKRIVVTVGEKIGKSHLTYSQGAAAELVAATTIALSGKFGWPVSTTHVLSSGIAGTMVANRSGLQRSTVRSIALAWLLTLPVAMVLGGLLFLLFRAVFA
jgi:PiT family inorganic phosphate transporter